VRTPPVTLAGKGDARYCAIQIAIQERSKTIDKVMVEPDGLLYIKECWYMPDDTKLKNTILRAEHDSQVIQHFGQFKTLGRVRANIYWPKMDKEVKDCVCRYDFCQRKKSTQYKKYRLLDLLNFPNRP
jgi:hypothetical protein